MKAVARISENNQFAINAQLKDQWAKLQNVQIAGLDLPFVLRYAVPARNMLAWLKSQNTFPYFYFQSRNKKSEIAGIGLYPNKHDQTITLEQWQALCNLHPQKDDLRLFFSRNFSNQETWGEFALVQHFMPNFYCERIEEQYFVNYLVPTSFIKSSTELESLYFKFKKESEAIIEDDMADLPTLNSRVDSPNQTNWKKNIAIVLSEIQKEQVSKVVLARRSDFNTKNSLPALAIMSALKAVKQNVYHYIYAPKPEQAFLGASPERLFKYENNKILTEALAGTSSIKDPESEKTLYADKNIREHELVVSGLIEKLKKVCQAQVLRAPVSTMVLSEMLHLYSRLEAPCTTQPNLDELIQALHPTASVCGTPSLQANKLIQSLEDFSRGLYAGPLGVATANSIECIVALRSCLVQKNSLSIFAGAGIVAGSNPDEEWQELETKIATILKLFKEDL